MEITPQLIIIFIQTFFTLISITMLIIFAIKRKNAKNDEEIQQIDMIISQIMPTAINGIKKLCEEQGIKLNKKETIKQTKRIIKEKEENGEKNTN